jgi:pimeloyl-ACP methyl ester carboxylesterase
MSVRRVGEPRTPRVAVFLHGLGETEHAWGARNYGERLHDELGITPVFVRFNSGRRISENGAALAALLDELVAGWPVWLESLALVGHSMGGLVARAACHHGGAWTKLVTHTVSLGTPHMGAPLEQAVHGLSAALHLVPETRPFARFLRRRSAGIRDLRRGFEAPLLAHATHCFVAATVTRSDKHPVGRLIGDTLVLAPSDSGRSRKRRVGFKEEHGLALGGTHHLALLNHPLIYERLHIWLQT